MTQLFMVHPGPLGAPSSASTEVPVGFELRPAVAADAEALSVLLAAAFAEPWDVERVRGALLDASDVVRTWVLVSSSDSRVVGTASERLAAEYPGSGYVHWVAVSDAVKGRRLGELVTRACLDGFAERGLERAVLETDDFRLPALRTYLRLGFVPEYRSDVERLAWSGVFRTLSR